MMALGIVQGLFGGERPDPASPGLAGGSYPNAIDVLAALASYGFSGVFIAGFVVLGARISLRDDVQAMDVLAFLPQFLKGLLTYVLMAILMGIGFLLLILPGIYLAVAYTFALPLALEKGLSPWQALETSRKAVTRRWFTVFAIVLLCQTVFFLGLVTFGIALIWFIPLIALVYGICYRNIFGVGHSAASIGTGT